MDVLVAILSYLLSLLNQLNLIISLSLAVVFGDET
jgi:hypothetical protein